MASWVGEYRLGLRRYFSSRVNISDVDDLVQEVFAHLHFQMKKSNTNIRNPRSYIYTIAKNLLVSHGRYQKSRCRAYHEPLSSEIDIPDVITPERTVIGMQDCRRVCQAILRLPPRAGTAFKFHRFEGLTYQDIAERMGISKESVKELIQRALVRIRKVMEEAV
ncbi:RNA polymerase sigma factor [Microbulbifer sp. MLAF003]|nr:MULTISPECIES: RNA polymerase sigma factor [Microbulbifer]WHI52614.1 RNA polymerase sigma factor [Microbulbifer sp. MLAF003]